MNPASALRLVTYVGAAVMLATSYYIIEWLKIDPRVFWAIVGGNVAGIALGLLTEYYTAAGPIRKIANKYRGKIMALALNILRNREDAEDACQDAFMLAYSNLSSFDTQKSFSNWLFTILYNRCLDQLRKRRRFFKFFKKMEKEPAQLSGNRTLNQPEDKPLVRSLLKRLSPKERTTLFLWAVEGYTSGEIASVLKCSPSTARVHIFKARKKVKNVLEKKNV